MAALTARGVHVTPGDSHGIWRDAGGGCAPAFVGVNLLPERTRCRLTERRRGITWMAINGLAALIGFGTWQFARDSLDGVSRERAHVAQQWQRVRREERISGGLNARLVLLQREYAALQALRPAETWATRLARLAQAMPEEALLTSVNVPPTPVAPAAATPPRTGPAARTGTPARTPSPAAATPARPPAPPVTLCGYAKDHARLAALLRRLTEEGGFAEARLVRSAAEGAGEQSVIQFEISATR
jgi:Tfp pilus assembly protein PilN